MLSIPEMPFNAIPIKRSDVGGMHPHMGGCARSIQMAVMQLDGMLVISLTMVTMLKPTAQPRWKRQIIEGIDMLRATLLA